MKISVSNNLSNITNYKYNNNNFSSKQTSLIDCFENTNSTKNRNNDISFKGSFFSKLFGIKEKEKPESTTILSPYARSLQEGIKNYFDEDIPAENFSAIMSPEEFKAELPNLSIENFDINNTPDKGKDKIYCADLDTATTFSVGKDDVYTLLEKAAKEADKYYKATGKKFIFAITDRDTIEGVQHAVRMVASEPDKFKNMKFVPSMKMSFTHKVPSEEGTIRYENSEMLIYGINPFSNKVVDFVSDTLKRREKMTKDFIKAADRLYPQFSYKIKEFAAQNGIRFQKDFGISNLYWRVREYVETKGDTEIRGISLSPEEIKKVTINILNELYKVQQGSENRNVSALGSTIVKDDENINVKIKEIFQEHATHESLDGFEVIAPAENTLSSVLELFKAEETRPVMAISAPYYLSHYFKDENPKTYKAVVEFLKDIQEKSEGMLAAFESKAPKYRLDDKLFERRTASDFPFDTKAFNPNNPNFYALKEQPILERFNNYLRHSKELNLYEVGGSWHDPYKDKITI